SAAWCFVALAAAGWATALVRGRLRRPNRQIALVLAVCCVAFGLAAWPVASFGRLTSVGATADAVAAARLSEQLQGRPLPLGDRTPTLAHTAELYVLGLLALLSRHRAFEVSTLMMALFFALTPAAVFVWARLGLRLPRGGALLAAGFVAVSNLLLWAVFDNFLAQVVATSLFPLVLAFGALGSRRPGWRDAATCGSLLGATATIYPVFAVYAALCVAAVWLAAQLRRRAAATLLQGVRFWLAAAGAAVVVDGLSLPRSWSYLRYVAAVARPGGARLVGFGDLLVFPSVYEVAGLTSHVASALNVRPWPLPRGAVSALALAAAACAVYGCLSLARGSRLALALPLAVLAGLAAAQRFAVNRPDGYPYGYYKTVSLLALVTAAALAAGLLAVARRPRWRAAAGLAAAAILGLNLMNSWWTVRYTIGHTALTPEVIDLAAAAAFLPPRAVVFTDVDPGLEQQWIRYLWWQRVAVFARGDPLPAGRSPFLRWALIEKRPGEDRRPAGEPWYEPASYRVLWQNGRFALRQRRDATLARLTWDQPLLQPGEVLELELAPARGCVRGTLGGRPAAAELGTGEPRGLLISAFGAGGGPARLAVEGEQPLALGPGGWQLAEDLVCRGSLRPVRIHNLGTSGVLVSEVAASSLSPGRSGGCLAATPLAAGLAYVEQQVAPPEVAYTV
ncbi:MAG: hypothetical protein JOZ15_06140, partial [Acidobacteria bacterium]|nr:hypothetical protein [Acidobacteriota bacterium]